MNKEFTISRVFEKIDTEKIRGKANDFPQRPTGDYVVPLLTAGIENQGLARYAKREQCPTILSNVLSVSANGANSGVVYYHPKEFAVLQDAYALKVRNYEIPCEEVGLYLASSLYKAIAYNHDWVRKAGWNNVKDDIFTLPIQTKENGKPVIDPECFYHDDGYIPDWKYMRERIAELERERIAELELYLIATGLNDYELTDEDIETLSLFVQWYKEEPDSKNVGRNVPKIKHFKCDDLFIAKTGDVDLQKKDIDGKGEFFINSGVENNGIKGRTSRPAKIFPAGTISIDFWGNAYYRDFDYKMATHNHVFSLSGDCIKNEAVGLFLVSQMSYMPNIFSYSNMGTWNKIKELTLALPVQVQENNNYVFDPDCTYHPDGYIPDWDFMERYIRAIEKLVIADVIKYKDDVIAHTEAIVNG